MNYENVLEFNDPIELAKIWLKQAEKDSQMTYPNAMSLATVDQNGVPSIRVVLLKELNSEGFVFFTNYNSRKGKEISKNPNVAANFYWDKPFRQIKIAGKVKKISRKESISYWNTRPKESQISQYVSQQSQPIESREKLDLLYKEAQIKFSNSPIECPEHWGGYILEPLEIIFWIGKMNRFHDCFKFSKNSSKNWLAQRLFP
jgi:pyridoxamine 5'-phosphate oxidase